MLTTPATIRDSSLLSLLGDILRPDIDPTTTGAMRLRLMRRGFSWQALVDVARGQDALLPLIFSLNARGLLPPVPRSGGDCENHVTVKLGNSYAQHLAWRQADKAQLEAILLVLAGAGIVPLILKGARYLVEPVASWCEARSMIDFDLLVRPDEAMRAVAALEQDGYRASRDDVIYGPKRSRHLPALEHPDRALSLEIHVNSLSPAGERIMSTEQVWARATKSGKGPFLVLPNSWHALHGLLHHQIQDRGHLRRTLCVKALWEWTMLAGDFTADDWDGIRAQMRAAGASDVLDSWLVQSHRLFGLEPPFLAEISAAARAHADTTFRLASRSYLTRRARHVADQLRVSFARETLADKYAIPPSRVSLVHAGRNAIDLVRRHRGNILQHLTGPRGQP